MKKNRKITIEEAFEQGFIPIENLEEIEDIGIFILNKEEKIVCFSKGCEKIDGYKREDVIGRHPREIYTVIHPLLSEDRQDGALSLASLREGKTYIDLYDCYQTTQRDDVEVSNSGYLLKNESEEVIGSVTIYREVSEYLNMVSIMNAKNADSKHYRLKNSDKQWLQYGFEDIIGKSSQIQQCVAKARIVAETEAPVLIYGETGTGKEVFAQSIHNEGPRNEAPFVAVNCSAIPLNLLESTLFGTVKGAFTGAGDTPGLFAEAEGGTLFLDELNSMDVTIQSKLLRVLETGSYRKVGGTKEIKSDVHIISALNQNPLEAIKENRLRSDLYYRLAVFVIDLPPLRDRDEDLILLAETFIRDLSGVLGKKVAKLSNDVVKVFKRYQWPGNIRELKHVITQSLYMAKNDEFLLKLQYLPKVLLELGKIPGLTFFTKENQEGLGLKERLDGLEKQMIEEELKKNGFNISKTARSLDVSRENLRNKIKKYEIKVNVE